MPLKFPFAIDGARVRIQNDLVRDLRLQKGWTVNNLSTLTGLSLKTIMRAEKPGWRVKLSTVELLAKALGVGSDVLMGGSSSKHSDKKNACQIDVSVSIIIDNDNIEAFSENPQIALIIEHMGKLANLLDQWEMVKVRKGSVIIELKLTEEDAKRLIEAFHQGKLDSLNISSVKRLSHDTRSITTMGKGQDKVPVRVPKSLNGVVEEIRRVTTRGACLCLIISMVINDARSVYLFGLILAGVAMIIKRRDRRLTAGIAFALNGILFLMWPLTIGFHNQDDGYAFGLFRRGTPEGTLAFQDISSQHFFAKSADRQTLRLTFHFMDKATNTELPLDDPRVKNIKIKYKNYDTDVIEGTINVKDLNSSQVIFQRKSEDNIVDIICTANGMKIFEGTLYQNPNRNHQIDEMKKDVYIVVD